MSNHLVNLKGSSLQCRPLPISFLDSSEFCSSPTLPNRGHLLGLRGSLGTLSLGRVEMTRMASLPVSPALTDPALIARSRALPAHRASLPGWRLVRQVFGLFYLIMSPWLLLSLPHSLLPSFHFQPISIFAALSQPN